MGSSNQNSPKPYIARRRYDEALALWPRYERESLQKFAYVARKCRIRIQDLSFGHHQLVAPLAPAEQKEWLEAAVRYGWTVAELRQQIRRRRADTPPMPVGEFATIVADPPWEVAAGPPWASGGPSHVLTYPMLGVDEIAALEPPAAVDAHLYLWTINRYVPDAYRIAEAWGFEPSTLLVWAKAPHGLGLGGTYVMTTEFVLFARRGQLETTERVDSSWFQWKRGPHSVKPTEFFEMVERVSAGPYLEMFARRPRDGWEVWGNEVAT